MPVLPDVSGCARSNESAHAWSLRDRRWRRLQRANAPATDVPGADGGDSDQEGLLEDDRRWTKERRNPPIAPGWVSGWSRRCHGEPEDYPVIEVRLYPVGLGSTIADQGRKLGDRPRAAAFIQEPSLKVCRSLVRRRAAGLGLHRRAGEPTDQGGDVRGEDGGQEQRQERRHPEQLREPSPAHQRDKSGRRRPTLSILRYQATRLAVWMTVWPWACPAPTCLNASPTSLSV